MFLWVKNYSSQFCFSSRHDSLEITAWNAWTFHRASLRAFKKLSVVDRVRYDYECCRYTFCDWSYEANASKCLPLNFAAMAWSSERKPSIWCVTVAQHKVRLPSARSGTFGGNRSTPRPKWCIFSQINRSVAHVCKLFMCRKNRCIAWLPKYGIHKTVWSSF